MAEVTIKIPDNVREFVAGTNETIYVEAIKEVARKKIPYTQKHLKELRKKITAYEKKHGKSFEEFSQNLPDTLKGHEDWIEWTYLINTVKELEHKIEKLKFLIGK